MAEQVYHLELGRVRIFDLHTYELRLNAGDISAAMVKAYLDLIQSKLQVPYRILLDHRQSVSYSFEAQQILSKHSAASVYAVVPETKAVRYNFEDIYLRQKPKPVYAYFHSPELALEWLLGFPLDPISSLG